MWLPAIDTARASNQEELGDRWWKQRIDFYLSRERGETADEESSLSARLPMTSAL